MMLFMTIMMQEQLLLSCQDVITKKAKQSEVVLGNFKK